MAWYWWVLIYLSGGFATTFVAARLFRVKPDDAPLDGEFYPVVFLIWPIVFIIFILPYLAAKLGYSKKTQETPVVKSDDKGSVDHRA